MGEELNRYFRMMGIDLKPLERGMDALVRMADALERFADIAEEALLEYRKK